ncbi:unnamed protein product [Rotaria sp. Silwood1]|nr:unnamed protein product [Rotaria sp. Silwood1]CAF1419634.1 unnamed protein product [Rotaria sp. Silwood1]CAF1448643.1 unnamed protein product [Rotaria sp. Silwood1]CAF3630514.1 unnamed protein product [Rotaria sp. Silwood1]CAF3680684.1 unnamed protein product [Rotaria sp. Silwood1]
MHHHHHLLGDALLAGAVGFGAYELWHHHQYGNFGFGNPYNYDMSGGYGSPYGYGSFGYPSYGGGFW